MRARLLSVLLVAALGLTASGCATLRDVPMPSLVGGPKYEVTAVFDNVLGLPEQAAVKMNGATIGEVSTIETVDYTARVGLEITDDVELPADVRAEIRLASPMGEAFVELSAPRGGGMGRLPAGGTIELAATSEAPGIGDLLSATSVLVTGGSFADMRTVLTELNLALRGNGRNVRGLIEGLDGMVTRLNDHTREFDVALDSMHRLSGSLARDRALLGRSLRALEPAVRTLSGQSRQILALMAQLRRLSRTGTATLRATRQDMLSVVGDLSPILDTLTRNQAEFDRILHGIEGFSEATESATHGLFLNFDLTTLVDPSLLLDPSRLLGREAPPASESQEER